MNIKKLAGLAGYTEGSAKFAWNTLKRKMKTVGGEADSTADGTARASVTPITPETTPRNLSKRQAKDEAKRKMKTWIDDEADSTADDIASVTSTRPTATPRKRQAKEEAEDGGTPTKKLKARVNKETNEMQPKFELNLEIDEPAEKAWDEVHVKDEF